MKIAIAQLNYTIGDFPEILRKKKTAYERAEKEKIDLLIFSELSICGYPTAKECGCSQNKTPTFYPYLQPIGCCALSIQATQCRKYNPTNDSNSEYRS